MVSKTKNQLMWDYMRRNRIFTIAEMMMILGFKSNTIKSFVYMLRKSGYVIRVQKNANLESHIFKLENCTGVKVPMITAVTSNRKVIDRNKHC